MMSRSELTILWALLLATLCHAGPINRQNGGLNTLHPDVRNQSYTEQNVCVSDDVLYQPGDLMPAPTPCSRCVCNPPGSVCTPVACEKRPGCKALQRPNQCCPEYQCECERNGRLYANGERLDNADNPCQACYCQGGEVVCTTVECYRRDDCEPQFVPGRCCPKYDHCPPLVMDDARYGEPFVAGDRPQHTRATFQPSSGLDGDADAEVSDDDQALGASTVQERVHVPHEESVATATTTPAPAPATAKDLKDVPLATEESPVTGAPGATDSNDAPGTTDAPAAATTIPPQDTPRDAAIKIDVPAVPWTETPEPSATDATTQVDQALEEGSGTPDEDTPDPKKDEPAIGIIERVGISNDENAPTASPTEEAVTDATTVDLDDAKTDATEAQTEEPITRLFMISKEAELDPTTVSTEYTDIPEEMSTIPDVTAPAKETTVAQVVDLSTEALLEATTATRDVSQAPEASTDSSPEFKDFDEWSGSKSSEFLRDSASTGSSSASSSGSDAHSKPVNSGSDESSSHFLATNINAETVKLSSDNSALPQSEGSSIDSTESAESTEESATTEISSSTESESQTKRSGNINGQPGTALDASDSTEEKPVPQKLDEEQSNEKVKKGEQETQKSNDESLEIQNSKKKGQPDIVLDTEATDENGPPILLIGDELANHQMDIIVATSSTEEGETETPNGTGELQMQETTSPPTEASDIATEGTTEQPQSSAKDDTKAAERIGDDGNTDETRTEKSADTTEAPTTDAADAQNEQGVTGSGDSKDPVASTERLEAATAAEDMMLSDDPLPGQAASAETAARDENLEKILGKTEEKKDQTLAVEVPNEDGVPSATELTTLAAEEATEEPVGLRLGDLRTESPERESTTNTGKEEDGTTVEPKYETSTITGKYEAGESKPIESQDSTGENVVERGADIPEGTNEGNEDKTTTDGAEGNPTTTEYPNTQRTDAETNAPSIIANEGHTLNEEQKSENVGAVVRAQPVHDEDNKDSDKELKGTESPEESSKDKTTTVSIDTTNAPATQYPVTDKSGNIKITEEDVMLGDQPMSAQSANNLQSTEEKEQKKTEEKDQKKNEDEKQKDEESTEREIQTENNTDKIEPIETEQVPEIKEKDTVKEVFESTGKPESVIDNESIQTTVLEQNTESVQKTELEKPKEQDIETQSKKEKDETEEKEETEQKIEVSTEQQQLEVTEQQQDKVPNSALVEDAKTPTNEEIAVKVGDLSNDELSTPPPDTTVSDTKIQDDSVTSLPVKSADPQEIITSLPEKSADAEEEVTSLPEKSATLDDAPTTENSADVTTVAPLDEQHEDSVSTGIKINPEVLELKPPVTVHALPTVNGTVGSTSELDATTLSPEWLKSDNNTKENAAHTQKEQEKEKHEEDAAAAGAVTEHQASPVSDADEGEQQRVERRVDEADKKDLFLLEDFFTKLYRHQIATDANKEH